MNVVKGAALAAVGLVTGIGLTVSANSIGKWYAELRQDIRLAATQTSQTSSQSIPPASPVSSPSVLISANSTAQPISFEQLSPCEQLDSVAKSSKSVAEFLVAANRVNDLGKYKTAIASTCPWNAEQLSVADRIINPPIVVVKPKVVQQSAGSSGGGGSRTVVIRESAPMPAWNNCNGVQEPGESYSARCDAAQQENDKILKNGFLKPLNPVDERPTSRQPSQSGNAPYQRGYSGTP